MSIWIKYFFIAAFLLIAELCYFKIAGHFSIIDKPNERSSHSRIVLRGGGVIFTLSIIVWFVLELFQGPQGIQVARDFFPFLCGLIMIAVVSFWDDIHSLPNSVRLVVQFIAVALMLWCLGRFSSEHFCLCVENRLLHYFLMTLVVIAAMIVFVGAINLYNFMDGINGITAGYAIAVLLPLVLINIRQAFIEESFLVVTLIGVLVFCIFNFRPNGKAKCFAGDVGSISIAFIILFAIGKLIVKTGDLTYFILLLIYGVDGLLTIVHRIMLHENLGQAHRKHAYQLMCNELKIGHVKISLLYMGMQLAVSLGFIYLCPDTVLAHWLYLFVVAVLSALAYVLFMKKYYHLHEEYLKSL